MSRSRRRTPIIGMCASARTSEKVDKKIWHRIYRRAQRQAIHHEREIMPHFREVSDVWGFTKDGKIRVARGGWRDEPKTMRK